MAEIAGESLMEKLRRLLLPCIRALTSALRVAEVIWMEGVLLKRVLPEAETIKNIEDSWRLLEEERGLERLEEHLREWVRDIQELLVESEQLRVETDDSGPQVTTEC